MTNVLYLSYGDPVIHRQAIFSILTLHHQLGGDWSGLRLVVCTDDPGVYERWLPGLEIVFEVLTPSLMQVWKGPTLYQHRIKLQSVRRVLHGLPGDVFFVDSDTHFLADPRPRLREVSEGVSLMHKPEYAFDELETYDEPLLRRMREVIRDEKFTVAGRDLPLGLDTWSWNSGILGISGDNRHLADEALELCDQFRDHVRNAICEQYAFACVLQDQTEVRATDEIVTHYWERPRKFDYDHAIKVFLREWSVRRDTALMAADAVRLAAGNIGERPGDPSSIPGRAKRKAVNLVDRYALRIP